MEQDLQKQIEDRIAELPEDIQQAIGSAELEQKVQAIGAKHHLHIDSAGKLQDEVMLVMLGFEPAEQFAQHLSSELGLPSVEAAAVTEEINNEIFMPIRESMKTFAPKPPAPTPPAKAQDLHPAEIMLAEKTLSVPNPTPPEQKPEPPKPTAYKADPYREPLE